MRSKNIWIFNAGNSFSGNPKWVFLYITKHHPEIEAYWYCYNDKLVSQMREMGYKACKFSSREGANIGEKAGVYVVEQNKEVIQDYLQGIVILNTWHGVGCKNIEKALKEGWMARGVAKKRILNNLFYKRDMLFLVTSPMMEKHFVTQCDIDEEKIIRAGYPRCEATGQAATFDHDILEQRGLPSDTRIVLYAPTFRDYNKEDFFPHAMPNMKQLIDVLEKTNSLFIFKVHPQLEEDFFYANLKVEYADYGRLLFWPNEDDIYEIMDQVDVGIVDYSSIFYDMVALGVPQFIRYIFDYEDGAMRDFAFDYFEMTCGVQCRSFDELIAAIADEAPQDQSAEISRINNLFWQYSDSHSCETLYERAMAFEPDPGYKLPALYSFDIFDTLVGRTTLVPRGVFRYVQDKARASGEYSSYFGQNYFKIRPWAEQNCREYMRKTTEERDSDAIEITLDAIMDRMGIVYSLSEAQKQQLKDWEIEAELLSTVPIPENIEKVLELKKQGEAIVLISDMYLPREVIVGILEKNCPELLDIPLYLSNETGHMKVDGSLFLDVYKDLDYCFARWIHTGDNQKSDVDEPGKLGIVAAPYVPSVEFDAYEKRLIQFADTFDMHQVATLFARYRAAHPGEAKNIFAYCYASLYFVPYVDWVINHAISQGTDRLVFISRDGHLLKVVADALIEANNYPIATKYIYGSRKAWRVPSQIREVDPDFFGEHGNFTGVSGFASLMEAADIDEETFVELFPEFAYLRDRERIDEEELAEIVQFLKASKRYHAHLLERSKEESVVVTKYLSQELDFSENNAFVEYWARGYTQTCLANLIDECTGNESQCVFYYARSIYPSEGRYKRFNYTTNTRSMLFIEALFANLPYTSVSAYEENNGIVAPVLSPFENNTEIFQALEEQMPAFVQDFSTLEVLDRDVLERCLFDFGLSHFHLHQTDKIYLDCIAPLTYSQTIYGEPVEFAPKLSVSDATHYLSGEELQTQSRKMSIARSNPPIKAAYKVKQRFGRVDDLVAKVRARLRGRSR